MRCKFCFATFQDVKKSILPKGHLPQENAIEVVAELSRMGFEKITFAGGEPTLCPWLSELISTAKQYGLTTMIVSNGTGITDEFLEENKAKLDWITLSIDSLNDETNLQTGRAIRGKAPITVDSCKELIDRVKSANFRLKINTVVSKANYTDDLSSIIEYAKPERWKIFQVLPIEGQNSRLVDDLLIHDEEYQLFVRNHAKLNTLTTIVPENNDEMKGTYAMVDPAGRFYTNETGANRYSSPICEVGAVKAYNEMGYNVSKFIQRGGIYDWKTK
jgi:radical S-adenosyl methionine domain-containing protein 2